MVKVYFRNPETKKLHGVPCRTVPEAWALANWYVEQGARITTKEAPYYATVKPRTALLFIRTKGTKNESRNRPS